MPNERSSPEPRSKGRSGDALLARAITRARWAIIWERLWPALVAPATAIGLFLAVSWFGTWLWLPPLARAIGVSLLVLLVLAAFVPLVRLQLPTREDALRRVDRNTRLPHRPATTIADDIAVTTTDPFSTVLWRAHVERALRAAARLKAGEPQPRLARRDPVAVRALVLVLVIATFVAAGGERIRRVTAAFDWHGVITPANFRVDAWVNPPTYTGKPPVILAGLRPGEPIPAPSALSVPVGSTLVIRATNIDLDIVLTGGLAEAKSPTPSTPSKGTEEHHFTVGDTGGATVHGVGSSDLAWQFTAIPDKPPTISLTKEPEIQSRGTFQLTYKVEDDYGVIDAHATAKLKQADKGDKATPRALFELPDFALVLPQPRTKNGVGSTTKDMTDSPLAGATAVMTLVARDEAGNEGKSESFELRLPERIFTKPMARALIEQRRMLALDADAQATVLTALDALTLAPDRFKMESNVYLGLRSIFWQLAHARNDDSLREVVARMWDMAVNIEDGNLSDAERALRQAEEALRQALERGATPEEIKKLTDELRAALDKFMQALAEQMRQNPQALARPLDPNAQRMRPQDLQNMIDKLEQMAMQEQKLREILRRQQDLHGRTSRDEAAEALAKAQGLLLQYLKNQIEKIPE
jgi:uncharacterized protein (TIGR02302 family)